MRFKNTSLKNFNTELASYRSIICFGVSRFLESFCKKWGNDGWLSRVCFFVDNDPSKWKRNVDINGKTYKVFSPYVLTKCHNSVLVISVGRVDAFTSIIKQLEEMDIDDSNVCYSLMRIENIESFDNSVMEVYLDKKTIRIPKTIHSFWFSKENKPQKYKKCIDSWKKYCPEYQIIEWNADSYDVNKNEYMKKAYEMRKWAFVSDFARLDVIYQYGGIYLDMDVELLKSLDDLLYLEAFFSIDLQGFIDLGSGFGAAKEDVRLRKLLSAYDGLEFSLEEDWEGTKRVVSQPVRLLPIFKGMGYKRMKDTQYYDHCMYLSPDYFRVIEDTLHEHCTFSGKEYGIHWHNAGWKSQEWIDERNRTNQEKRDQFRYYDMKVK